MSNNVLINVPVQSVNGLTGAVVLDATDIGAANIAHTHVEADIIDLQAYLTDAPNDGIIYGRQNESWVEVESATIEEAPANGYPYVRRNETWERPKIVTTGVSATNIGIKIDNADATDSYTIPSATTSEAGLLTATDKTKLDGLSAISNTDDVPEGASNLYYTEGRVSNNTTVVNNTNKLDSFGSNDPVIQFVSLQNGWGGQLSYRLYNGVVTLRFNIDTVGTSTLIGTISGSKYLYNTGIMTIPIIIETSSGVFTSSKIVLNSSDVSDTVNIFANDIINTIEHYDGSSVNVQYSSTSN